MSTYGWYTGFALDKLVTSTLLAHSIFVFGMVLIGVLLLVHSVNHAQLEYDAYLHSSTEADFARNDRDMFTVQPLTHFVFALLSFVGAAYLVFNPMIV